jgi:tripartite-type tricarboxylate transporter receptor subunit TctC
MVKAEICCSIALVLVALGALPQAYAGDDYPSHPVRIISPYAAGGTPDIVARALAEQLSERLKQSFIVENRTGANGTIASESVASAAPDGYTLLLASDGPIVIMPLMHHGEDPLRKLVPVNLAAESAFVLMARTDLGVHTLADLIALAKKQPLTFGSAGVGSQHHLAGELLKSRASINLVHVPYKGSTEALADLVGKRIDLMFGGIPPSLPFITAHSVTPIAVTSLKRNAQLPDVPTIAEEGFPGYRVAFWAGIMAPARTPRPVIDKLDATVSDALKSADVVGRFSKIGADIVNAGPTGFTERLESDQATWNAVIQQAGLATQ